MLSGSPEGALWEAGVFLSSSQDQNLHLQLSVHLSLDSDSALGSQSKILGYMFSVLFPLPENWKDQVTW